MEGERETSAGKGPAEASAAGEKAATAKGAIRQGLLVAVATVIRAGDAVTSATAEARQAMRSFVSEARTRARRISEEAARRRTAEGTRAESSEAEPSEKAEEGG